MLFLVVVAVLRVVAAHNHVHETAFNAALLEALVNDTSIDNDDAFNIYLDVFDKAYDDPIKYEKHKQTFLRSLDYIRAEQQQHGVAKFKAALTPMSDVDATELLGKVYSSNVLQNNTALHASSTYVVWGNVSITHAYTPVHTVATASCCPPA